MKSKRTVDYSLQMQVQDFNTLNDQNINYLMDTIRKGVDFSFFKNILSNSPFSLSEWSKFLHLSERTMQRYKKDQKPFDALQ